MEAACPKCGLALQAEPGSRCPLCGSTLVQKGAASPVPPAVVPDRPELARTIPGSWVTSEGALPAEEPAREITVPEGPALPDPADAITPADAFAKTDPKLPSPPDAARGGGWALGAETTEGLGTSRPPTFAAMPPLVGAEPRSGALPPPPSVSLPPAPPPPPRPEVAAAPDRRLSPRVMTPASTPIEPAPPASEPRPSRPPQPAPLTAPITERDARAVKADGKQPAAPKPEERPGRPAPPAKPDRVPSSKSDARGATPPPADPAEPPKAVAPVIASVSPAPIARGAAPAQLPSTRRRSVAGTIFRYLLLAAALAGAFVAGRVTAPVSSPSATPVASPLPATTAPATTTTSQ